MHTSSWLEVLVIGVLHRPPIISGLKKAVFKLVTLITHYPVVKLNESGPHYFISGLVENCKNNEKIVIVVMADRSNRHQSPPSSPPSPAPAGEESPSPPPAPATEDNSPTPTPNAASSIATSFVYSIVAFAGSSFLSVI
ncbi:hypothetical protein L1987_85173 [Smallanthus sonchifolius]|uniref:Uncharacterized protein n=1 Tax=Smallanthus sonchifolius TaxID=185202 RepID=A0ACB8XWG1_9ASTR|nr:hypothetical protein L1987_85173 [Smallanthus sonchifolius]